MKTTERRFPRKQAPRRGAVTPLIAMLLVAILSIGAFAISISQIQLARTQAQTIADCASLSATTVLGEQHMFNDESWDEIGQRIAESNRILGKPAVIARDNIQLGNAGADLDGNMVFRPGVRPRNAVRVNVQMGDNTAMGSVPLAFPFLFDVDTFSVKATSVTAKVGHDVCLCIDRSTSMNARLDGKYPPAYYHDRPGGPASAKYYPNPIDSRWAGLMRALPVVLDAFRDSEIREEVSLVTFGSARQWDDGDLSTYYSGASIDVPGTLDYDKIEDELRHMWDQRPMVSGQTWIDYGIESAIDALSNPDREFAHKTIILLTDGEQYPRTKKHYAAAQIAADEGITIHTICYAASGRGQKEMQDVAKIGGGKYFFAGNQQELKEVFAEIGQISPITIAQ